LKANILYPSVNPYGGGERLAIVTMQAVSEAGIDFELTTFESPNINRIKNAFGQQMTSAVKKAKRINILESFEQGIKRTENDYPYNLTINAHAQKDKDRSCRKVLNGRANNNFEACLMI
jgi:hypothetical protein